MGAAAVLLVGGMIAGGVGGDRLKDRVGHRPVVAAAAPIVTAMASPSRFLRTPALDAAALPVEASSDRFSQVEPVGQVAAFVHFPHVAAAHSADSKGDRVLSGEAKPLMASAGHEASPSLPTGVLAYASASQRAEGGALAAIDSATHVTPGFESMEEAGEEEALLLPEAVPLPEARPNLPSADAADDDEAPARRSEQPAGGKITDRAPEKPETARPDKKAVAMARPNVKTGEEGESSPGLFKKLFSGRPRAGNGVAVYDISAGKVYMPDGSVLAAASGIGKMANNPRYAHVRMNGPTPPHTYNLRMRETRFHGVEAIRMLPVDGKNKHGRDGFLAHSELLRGRPGQSHGCVAFKDYNKFLRAFKQGKVKQMIVVPGGGAGVFARSAAKGNDV